MCGVPCVVPPQSQGSVLLYQLQFLEEYQAMRVSHHMPYIVKELNAFVNGDALQQSEVPYSPLIAKSTGIGNCFVMSAFSLHMDC